MAERSIPHPPRPVQLDRFIRGDMEVSGVYFLFDRMELVYIGQTKNIGKRLWRHMGEARKVFDAIAFIPCGIDRLCEIESHYIRKYTPKYNDCDIARSYRCKWRPDALDPADLDFMGHIQRPRVRRRRRRKAA